MNKIKKEKNNPRIKDLIYISIVYFATNWFLLIMTGRWWDDWCLWNQEPQSLINMAMEMGRPEVIYIVRFIKLFPEPFYRLLTFVMFYLTIIFTYNILVKGLSIRRDKALVVSVLSIVIPVNVDRTMLCIFPYTVGYFFFFLGFDLLINIDLNMKNNLLYRALLLILFTISFVLNSCLFFYSLVLIYILFKTKSIKGLLRYIDFIIIPVLFYIIKIKLFGLNSISLV